MARGGAFVELRQGSGDGDRISRADVTERVMVTQVCGLDGASRHMQRAKSGPLHDVPMQLNGCLMLSGSMFR